jgi:(2Fe-2S) ferredoxin
VESEEVWYTYASRADIDEIVESHLKNGVVVDRLTI